jgi:hypothetical protein
MAAGSMAAGATKDASNAAITEQQAALQQQATLSQPYRDLGTSNMQTYQNLLTGGDKGAAGIESTLQSLPGYKATMDTGIEAAKRASAAGGLNLSGNQVAAVETFGAQLGDQTYQQQLSNLLQPIQLGQAAAAGQAANIGAAASNISNIGIAQGNNMAAIDANTIAGVTRAGSNTANQMITYNTLQGLNNPGGGAPTYAGGSYSAINDANYFTPVSAAAAAPVPTYGGP